MKVFISHSGDRSHEVAKLLDWWIQCVIQAVNPFLSSKDIDRGARWFTKVSTELANTHNGIICLTKSNKDKPWILFEAGALAKGLESTRVITLLIDFEWQELKGPLTHFNHTHAKKKEEMLNLLKTINRGLEQNQLSESILEKSFETFWPEFEEKFNSILESDPDENVEEKRPQYDIMVEILELVRGLERKSSEEEIGIYAGTIHPEDLSITYSSEGKKKPPFEILPFWGEIINMHNQKVPKKEILDYIDNKTAGKLTEMRLNSIYSYIISNPNEGGILYNPRI